MNVMLAVFAGGGLGALMRHYAVLAAARLAGEGFPYGTMAVNILGCLAAGALMEYLALRGQWPLELRALVFTGFLGGFTTFSAFSIDFFRLLQAGNMTAALGYAALTVVLALGACMAGILLMRGVLA